MTTRMQSNGSTDREPVSLQKTKKNSHGVWKPAGSKVYYCSLQVAGERHCATTGCANKEDAMAFSRRWKVELQRKAAEVAASNGGNMRFLAAVNLYMEEAGEKLVAADMNEVFFDWLVDEIGADTRLFDINETVLKKLIKKRSACYRWNNEKHGLVSPVYVQRAVTDRLGAVLNHAQTVWKIHLPHCPRWKLFQQEIKIRTRTLNWDEEDAIRAVAGDLWPLIEFILLTGLRHRDTLIRWSNVDWDANVIKLKVKGDKEHEIRITEGIRRLLEDARGKHDEFVFCWTHESGAHKGKPRPVDYKGFTNLFAKTCRRAGVSGLTIHDLRRTTGERMYRVTGDIAAVSKFLAHANVQITLKHYVHIVLDHVAERQVAMEQARERIQAERAARKAVGTSTVH